MGEKGGCLAFASGRLPEGLAGGHIEILSIKEDNENASLHFIGHARRQRQFCPDTP